MTLDDADDFVARRVHFPAGPGFLEAEKADDAPFVEVVAVARLILLVPLGACELRFGNGPGGEPEVDREVEQRLAAVHSSASTPIGAQALVSQSRSLPESV